MNLVTINAETLETAERQLKEVGGGADVAGGGGGAGCSKGAAALRQGTAAQQERGEEKGGCMWSRAHGCPQSAPAAHQPPHPAPLTGPAGAGPRRRQDGPRVLPHEQPHHPGRPRTPISAHPWPPSALQLQLHAAAHAPAWPAPLPARPGPRALLSSAPPPSPAPPPPQNMSAKGRDIKDVIVPAWAARRVSMGQVKVLPAAWMARF